MPIPVLPSLGAGAVAQLIPRLVAAAGSTRTAIPARSGAEAVATAVVGIADLKAIALVQLIHDRVAVRTGPAPRDQSGSIVSDCLADLIIAAPKTTENEYGHTDDCCLLPHHANSLTRDFADPLDETLHRALRPASLV